MKRILALIVGVVILLGILAEAVIAATLEVPSTYQTIQSAIDVASYGDTVLVAPGEYAESIRLREGVNVQSVGGAKVTTLLGDGTSLEWCPDCKVTVFGASYSTISGFSIVGVYGIYNQDVSPTITNNIIVCDRVAIINNYSASIISNNIITAGWHGIYNYRSNTTITNNIIFGEGANIASGITSVYWSSPTVTNNIITGNAVGLNNYLAFPTITNNDIWGNGTNFYNRSAYPVEANNISTNPMFVDLASWDFHLNAGSPCIDTGRNNAPGLPLADADGNARIADGNNDGVAVVDMGAFEYYVVCTGVPEFEIVASSPSQIWPPNRKMQTVSVSGRVIVPEGCTLQGASYSMNDEYGLYSTDGALSVGPDGYFSFAAQVEAWRDGWDIDGRHYSLSLFAEDEAGIGSSVVQVAVPHDQR